MGFCVYSDSSRTPNIFEDQETDLLGFVSPFAQLRMLLHTPDWMTASDLFNLFSLVTSNTELQLLGHLKGIRISGEETFTFDKGWGPGKSS